ncbi:MAG TPA: ferredoxin--NADP reductase [Eoetvoesiella sp.]
MPDRKYTQQTVISVKKWLSEKLLSITTTRDPAFTFKAGQFARLGLPDTSQADGVPSIWRAYSMVNAPGDDTLEFYSIVVPEGEFSPRFAQLRPNDPIYIDKTAFGFLTVDRFEPNGHLWLLATGTGLSAYLSMLQDSNTWSSFDRIILVHGVRTTDELAYRDQLAQWAQTGLAESHAAGTPRARLTYLPIPTQESLPNTPQGRLTTLIANGQLEQHAGCSLDPAQSKVMLCGNPDMLTEARKLLSDRGFAVGRRGNYGNLAVENYW